MVNKVFLIGRLGKDPIIKTTQSQQTVCQFSLATTERRGGKDGAAASEHTEWHNIVAWGKTGEMCERYLTKGKKVFIEGKITSRSWEKDGQRHNMTEIVANSVQFLDSATSKASDTTAQSKPFQGNQAKQQHPYDDLNAVPF